MSYHREPPKAVENYTDAFFTVLGVLLFVVLWTIAAVAGYLWMLITAWSVDFVGRMICRRLR